MIGAENGVQLVFMQDNHARANLCGFQAAHFWSNAFSLISSIPVYKPLCEAAHVECNEAHRTEKHVPRE
jgi:hypothetical protein